MTDHDPLCPHDTHPFPATCETCILLAKVRADEQRWKPPLDSLVRANQRLIQQRADLRAQVEARIPATHDAATDAYRDVLALLDEAQR